MMLLSFFCFRTERPLFGKFGANCQYLQFFFVSDQKCPFLGRFGPKCQSCQFKAKFASYNLLQNIFGI